MTQQTRITSAPASLPDPLRGSRLAAVRRAGQPAFGSLAEPYRRELQAHCYRLLGSVQEAEDMVQETMLRAWRRLDTYEGRASFRAWLYRIATHACYDALKQRARRGLAAAPRPTTNSAAPAEAPAFDTPWLEPFPDDWLAPAASGPEARYAAHESIRLAFVAALQALPARQRAVLILRDVLDWPASETAVCLEMTVPAVNSALHRARATLSRHYHGRAVDSLSAVLPDEALRDLLDRYVRAWEAADMASLVALLREDAVLTMPPGTTVYVGRATIVQFLLGMADSTGATTTAAQWRLLPVAANGQPAFALYERRAGSTDYRPLGVQVLTLEDGRLRAITSFMTPALVGRFGLPESLGPSAGRPVV